MVPPRFAVASDAGSHLGLHQPGRWLDAATPQLCRFRSFCDMSTATSIGQTTNARQGPAWTRYLTSHIGRCYGCSTLFAVCCCMMCLDAPHTDFLYAELRASLQPRRRRSKTATIDHADEAGRHYQRADACAQMLRIYMKACSSATFSRFRAASTFTLQAREIGASCAQESALHLTLVRRSHLVPRSCHIIFQIPYRSFSCLLSPLSPRRYLISTNPLHGSQTRLESSNTNAAYRRPVTPETTHLLTFALTFSRA